MLHLRWLGADRGARRGRGGAQAEAADARHRAGRRAGRRRRGARRRPAAALPDLRDAAARGRRGAAAHRASPARRSTPRRRRVRDRLGELDRRLAQLADDIGREERMIADNRAILARLDEEETRARGGQRGHGRAAGEGGAAAHARPRRRSPRARRRLASSTERHAEIVAAARPVRARHRARRRAARRTACRRDRDRSTAELPRSTPATAGRPSRSRQAAVDAAEAALRPARGATVRYAEAAARGGAASTAPAAREPLAEAERALGRIEAESATLAAILAARARRRARRR